MELRSVLGKKKQLKQERVAELERRVTSQVEIVVPDASDMHAANKRHQETLLYPMDCLFFGVYREPRHDISLVRQGTH